MEPKKPERVEVGQRWETNFPGCGKWERVVETIAADGTVTFTSGTWIESDKLLSSSYCRYLGTPTPGTGSRPVLPMDAYDRYVALDKKLQASQAECATLRTRLEKAERDVAWWKDMGERMEVAFKEADAYRRSVVAKLPGPTKETPWAPSVDDFDLLPDA